MPDLFSFGLGGGSIVTKSSGSSFTVGPISIGSQLMAKCQSLGGDT
jgi:N-methylhydantoinase A/oxoprolinase/acetone carboxylase beta subunit